jgi:hypothetical protein
MMQFTRVDDDAYDVRMNLDAIKRIGAFFRPGEVVEMDERDNAIANGFDTAYKSLSASESE